MGPRGRLDPSESAKICCPYRDSNHIFLGPSRVKYTDNLAEEEMTLQGTIYRRNKVGNNCGKVKVMRIKGSHWQFR